MRKIKRFVATALACAMVLSMSATAFAAENGTVASEPVVDSVADSDASGSNDIMPRISKPVSVGNGYVNVTDNDLYNPHGNGWFYYQVSSEGYSGWNYQINCLMYDGTGSVVWRGDNICGVGSGGRLEYGGNVVRIDLQIAPRAVLIPSKAFEVTVTY